MPDQPAAAVPGALPDARTATALSDRSRVPRASVVLSVLSSHLCHHAGAWASRTPVPTGHGCAEPPSVWSPLQPLPAPLLNIPAASPLFSIPGPRSRAVGRHVLLCCALALPSLRGPWLPALVAAPWVQPIPPEGRWPEQEGLSEAPVALDLFTLWAYSS